METKEVVRQFVPPILWQGLRLLRQKARLLKSRFIAGAPVSAPQSGQDMDVYWDDKMAALLETWGEGNVWDEIKFLMANCKGKVLDIACGTGKTIETLSSFQDLELYGCDISDFLIQKAVDRGIRKDRLKVCDATKSGYATDAFDYSYSIGSLEHFTEEGIALFILEAYRITRYGSFHMVPVSRSGKDEGWMKTYQSFHNNSPEWWVEQLKRLYRKVYVIDSRWQDDISVGKWIVCFKEGE